MTEAAFQSVLAAKRLATPEGECLRWARSFRRDGYGQVGVDGQIWAAHRAVYVALVGPIPPGMCLLHSCDNRWCIEPTHLRVGTKADNTADMVAKGRAKGGRKYWKKNRAVSLSP